MLNIEKVTLGYGGKAVLDFKGLDLPICGQCLLSGASGSGKTTLLYAIAGLNPVIQGRITINGTEITALSEVRRDYFRGQNIGIIFQTLHLVKSLTVLENLLLASYITGHPQDEKYVLSILKKLGIENKKDAMPSELSQGQAQRVAIARAVLNKPKLILADEPTASLDDKNCEEVISLIKQVADDTGSSLVIATHDARVKAHFSNIIKIGE